MSLGRDTRSVLGLGIALVAGGLLLGFALVNQALVEVDLLMGAPVAVPLWLLIVVCFGLGWLLPRVLGLAHWMRGRRERVNLGRRIEELEDEVVALRNIPLSLGSRPRAVGAEDHATTGGRDTRRSPTVTVGEPTAESERPSAVPPATAHDSGVPDP